MKGANNEKQPARSPNYAEGADMPLGFGMALAQNTLAMEAFSGMSREEQKQILSKVPQIQSKAEMRSYVDSLTNPPASL